MGFNNAVLSSRLGMRTIPISFYNGNGVPENPVWVMLNMRKTKKKLVIFGLKVYAEIVWDYFTNDSGMRLSHSP